MTSEAEAPKYRLVADEDGKLQLYYARFNSRVATFSRGIPEHEREVILAALSAPRQPMGEKGGGPTRRRRRSGLSALPAI